MVSKALQSGFDATRRRLGAVALDIAWKLIWLVTTLALAAAFGLWVYRELGAIEFDGAVPNLSNPLAMMALARELWKAYATTVFGMLAALALASSAVWVLLESYFRARMFSAGPERFFGRSAASFRRFLGLACLKMLLIGEVVAIFGIIVFRAFFVTTPSEWRNLWMDARSAFVVSVVIIAAVWFVLTMMETLARNNALELLGPHLFEIAGAFATLWLFEMMIALSAVMAFIVVASLLPASAAIVVLGIGLLFLAVLVLLHSYLVIVRYQVVRCLL